MGGLGESKTQHCRWSLDQSIDWMAGHCDASGLTNYSDHGTQDTSTVYGTRLNEAGILASTGSMDDSSTAP